MHDPLNHSPVDWTELARSVGTLREDGSEHGSSIIALEAIVAIIGSANLCAAVDHYIAHKPGAELARFVLWRLHPWCAMERCYELYLNADDPDVRCTAVELLRVVADRRALPWIRRFLEDPDPGIQTWGAGIVDQLLWSDLIEPAECEDLLLMMVNHSNEQVRDRHLFVLEYLTAREQSI
ncbi:MAG: HEAT repeat domain-containing protein [Planctomycetota bacterium]